MIPDRRTGAPYPCCRRPLCQGIPEGGQSRGGPILSEGTDVSPVSATIAVTKGVPRCETVTVWDRPESVTVWDRPENVTVWDRPENVTIPKWDSGGGGGIRTLDTPGMSRML